MRTHALIIGKFYPPHKGHHYLIDTAVAECDKVTVLVMAADIESIPGEQRVEWLEEVHGYGVDIRWCVDNHPVEYSDYTWNLHMQVIFDALMPPPREYHPIITHVYSSEKYGDELARRMSEHYNWLDPVKHRCVDLDRTVTKGSSATRVRKDPMAEWNLLSAPVKRSLAKRIVICGAESSGTTTLSRTLAAHFKTTWALEYGRYFTDMRVWNSEWSTEDFAHITKTQAQIENKMAELSTGLVICDTDGYTTSMYHDLWLHDGKHGFVWEPFLQHRDKFPATLYIVTDQASVPFEDDGTRINEKDRPWQHDWLIQALKGDQQPYVVVSGTVQEMFFQAVEAIKPRLIWNFEDPIEYRQNSHPVHP